MKKFVFLFLFSLSLFAQERTLQVVPDTLIRPRPNLYGLAARNNNLYLVPRTGNMIKILKETFPGSTYVTILGTVATGIWNATLISVSYGGTGASTASGARANLGLAIGSDVQAYDSDLNTIAGQTATTDNFLIGTASAWASRTPSQARTSLGLGTLATQSGTFSGTSSGTNTGDQTITLTGDATGSGGGSFAVTIANGVVSLTKLANVATGTIFYRKTAGTGSPEVQTLATLKTDLGLTGSNSGDQTIILTGDITGSGTGSFSTSIANNAVTLADMAQITTNSILGRVTASTGNVEVLSAANVKTILSLGSVENTALSTWAGTTNITTLGTITNGVWSGTAIAVAKGGTGATDASTARTNLGLVIGTNVQAYDADLSTYAGITPTTVGQSLIGLTNPSAVRFLRVNANNTITARTAAEMLSDIGGGAGTLTGSGTSNYVSKWNGSTSQTNSIIQDNGTNVGIGTSSLGAKLHVNGSIYAGNSGNVDVSGDYIALNAPDFRFTRNYGGASGLQMVSNNPFHLITNNTIRATVKANGAINFAPLASAPASPAMGDFYVNSGDGKGYMYNGSTWNALW